MITPETEIIVTQDGAKIAHHTFTPGEYIIGRDPGCRILIEVDGDGVSRRHAKLTINHDHALIEDLGSSNGTFVNDKPVTESLRLWPNQKIRQFAGRDSLSIDYIDIFHKRAKLAI